MAEAMKAPKQPILGGMDPNEPSPWAELQAAQDELKKLPIEEYPDGHPLKEHWLKHRAQWYGPGSCLNVKEHYQLVEDADRIAIRAGIRPQALAKGIIVNKDPLDPDAHEIRFIYGAMQREGDWKVGMGYRNEPEPSGAERLQSITAALARQARNVRFIMRYDLLKKMTEGQDFEEMDWLLCPDLLSEPDAIPAGWVDHIRGMLTKRMIQDDVTIVGRLASRPALEQVFGVEFINHVFRVFLLVPN